MGTRGMCISIEFTKTHPLRSGCLLYFPHTRFLSKLAKVWRSRTTEIDHFFPSTGFPKESGHASALLALLHVSPTSCGH